jgi:thymidylate synthase (FAD)
MVEFKFRIKCPLIVARQWMRHRMWNYNETSRRYTSEDIDFYVPDIWRKQATSNRQASQGQVEDDAAIRDLYQEVVQRAFDAYDRLLEAGVAREQARAVLPQSMYTHFIGKVDAHNLLHFLHLRMAEEAQHEIRLYATAIFEDFVKPALPWTAEAFEKFVLGR